MRHPRIVTTMTSAMALAMALALTMTLASAPVEGSVGAEECAGQGTESSPPVPGPIFNDPAGDRAAEYRIVEQINANIAGTPPGSVIRVATLSIDLTETVDRLLEAHRCGVVVRVTVPGKVLKQPEGLRLREALGTDTTRPSYITGCRDSCFSRDRGPGTMHAKSYLFSRTGGRDHVTIYSSQNLVAGQAERHYNDAYQVVGDQDLYRLNRVFFDLMRFDRETDVPRERRLAHHWLGWTPDPAPRTRDHFSRLLEATGCRSGADPTRVQVAASIWDASKLDAAQRLVALRDRGCDVAVLFNKDFVSAEVMQLLLDEGVPTRLQSSRDGDEANHSKFVAIDGTHHGRDVSTVYTGSLNLSQVSIRRSDNNVVRIVDDPDTFGAYLRRFELVWGHSRVLTQRDVHDQAPVSARRAEGRD